MTSPGDVPPIRTTPVRPRLSRSAFARYVWNYWCAAETCVRAKGAPKRSAALLELLRFVEAEDPPLGSYDDQRHLLLLRRQHLRHHNVDFDRLFDRYETFYLRLTRLVGQRWFIDWSRPPFPPLTDCVARDQAERFDACAHDASAFRFSGTLVVGYANGEIGLGLATPQLLRLTPAARLARLRNAIVPLFDSTHKRWLSLAGGPELLRDLPADAFARLIHTLFTDLTSRRQRRSMSLRTIRLADGSPLGLPGTVLCWCGPWCDLSAHALDALAPADALIVCTTEPFDAAATRLEDLRLPATWKRSTLRLLAQEQLLNVLSTRPWLWSRCSPDAALHVARPREWRHLKSFLVPDDRTFPPGMDLAPHPAVCVIGSNQSIQVTGRRGSGKSVALYHLACAAHAGALIISLGRAADSGTVALLEALLRDLADDGFKRFVILLDDLDLRLDTSHDVLCRCILVREALLTRDPPVSTRILVAYASEERARIAERYGEWFRRGAMTHQVALNPEPESHLLDVAERAMYVFGADLPEDYLQNYVTDGSATVREVVQHMQATARYQRETARGYLSRESLEYEGHHEYLDTFASGYWADRYDRLRAGTARDMLMVLGMFKSVHLLPSVELFLAFFRHYFEADAPDLRATFDTLADDGWLTAKGGVIVWITPLPEAGLDILDSTTGVFNNWPERLLDWCEAQNRPGFMDVRLLDALRETVEARRQQAVAREARTFLSGPEPRRFYVSRAWFAPVVRLIIRGRHSRALQQVRRRFRGALDWRSLEALVHSWIFPPEHTALAAWLDFWEAADPTPPERGAIAAMRAALAAARVHTPSVAPPLTPPQDDADDDVPF